ncbi:hypothetical protein ACNKHO_27290 [Shigella flexneri]
MVARLAVAAGLRRHPAGAGERQAVTRRSRPGQEAWLNAGADDSCVSISFGPMMLT